MLFGVVFGCRTGRLAFEPVKAGDQRTVGEGARARIGLGLGKLPGSAKNCPLSVEILQEEDLGSYVRQTLSFAAEPGERVPAYLLIPKGALGGSRRQFPGVLALHQTHSFGHRVVVGLGNSPDDEYGIELVQRGFVVLAPPYPLLANYYPDLHALGWDGGMLKAIWNNRRGIDLLAALPYVRTNGFACIGHSLGGHTGLFTAAFDDRIKVVVTSCGFDSFRDYYDGNPAVWQPERGWCQTRYLPRLLAYSERLADLPFDFSDVFRAVAPRAVFVNAPLGDTNFRWRSVDRVLAEVRPEFEGQARAKEGQAIGKTVKPKGQVIAVNKRQAIGERALAERLVVVHPDSPHRFPPDVRLAAYEFIERNLGLRYD